MSQETVTEVRMRIAAFLERGDFQAAQAEMEKIKTAAKGIEDQQINASRATTTAANTSTNATQGMSQEWRKATMVASALSAGMRNLNNVGNALSATAMAVGSAFSKAVPWIAGLSIAANIFTGLKSLMGHFSGVKEKEDEAKKAAVELQQELATLGATSLDTLNTSLEATSKAMQAARDAAAALLQHQEALLDLDMRKEIATKTAGLEGDEKDRATFEIQSRYGTIKREKRQEFYEGQIGAADKNIRGADAAIESSAEAVEGPKQSLQDFKKEMARLGVLDATDLNAFDQRTRAGTLAAPEVDWSAKFGSAKSQVLNESTSLSLEAAKDELYPDAQRKTRRESRDAKAGELSQRLEELNRAEKVAPENAATLTAELNAAEITAKTTRAAKTADIEREKKVKADAQRQLERLAKEGDVVRTEEAQKREDLTGMTADGAFTPKSSASIQASADAIAEQGRQAEIKRVADAKAAAEKKAAADQAAEEKRIAEELRSLPKSISAAEKQLAVAQAAADAPSQADQALDNFENTKSPTYKRSQRGRSEYATLQKAVESTETAQADGLDAIIAALKRMQTKYEEVAANTKTGDTY
jgi:hypothetical protein